MKVADRPDWLSVNRTLGALGLVDDESGIVAFRAYMHKRVSEICGASNPMEAEADWVKIRRGWCLGDAAFREKLLEKLDDVIECKGRRDSFCGEQAREHDAFEAERLLEWGLKRLSVLERDLVAMRKSDPVKQVLCWLLRHRTIVTSRWITDRLHCGHPSSVSSFVGRVACAKEGVLFELRESLKSKD